MQLWCEKCKDFMTPTIHKWESSIAIMQDDVCPICGEYPLRGGEYRVEYKPNHPDYGKK